MTDELMSLEDIDFQEKSLITFGLKAHDEEKLLKRLSLVFATARAAHEYQQKVVDLLDENKNLDHSNKMLREENEKLREQLSNAIKAVSESKAYEIFMQNQELREENEKIARDYSGLMFSYANAEAQNGELKEQLRVENVAADAYWNIANLMATPNGGSVWEHVSEMRELLKRSSEYLHDVPDPQDGGDSSITELCKEIRACLGDAE